ncbi:LysR substrate-binding domain-containing protein [Pseudomonas aeruginosa]|uniref:LysR substrate-binding domain-containing protein n=1 Tax=Pseudomonas aeruginosa TaxID=287 RepID=UPI00378B3DB8
MVIAPEGHPILEGGEVHFKEALQYAFVSLLEGSAIHVFLSRAASALHIPLTIRVQVASSDAIFRMVEAGAGIAIVPQAGFERLEGQPEDRLVQAARPLGGAHLPALRAGFRRPLGLRPRLRRQPDRLLPRSLTLR